MAAIRAPPGDGRAPPIVAATRSGSALGFGDDVLIGVPYSTVGGSGSGQAVLFRGPLSGNSYPSGADASFVGPSSSAHAGWSVAGAGDVNGDSVLDLLIGSPSVGAGEVALVYGPFTGTRYLNNPNVVFEGEVFGDLTGAAVAGGADLDADGYADVLIGAPNDRTGAIDQYMGAVYLARTPLPGCVDLTLMDYKVVGDAQHAPVALGDDDDAACGYGGLGDDDDDDDLSDDDDDDDDAAEPGDYAGRAVDFGGDVDNDGLPDLLVGAWNNARVGPAGGAVYVISGASVPAQTGVDVSCPPLGDDDDDFAPDDDDDSG